MYKILVSARSFNTNMIENDFAKGVCVYIIYNVNLSSSNTAS